MDSKVIEFLKSNPVQYLATVGRDGKAKCRPFMFAGELDGRFWFCTNSTKDVYKDMIANPEIEISVSSPEYAWIRLHGRAVFEDNTAAKEMCMLMPIVKGLYKTPDNPIFEVFYLEDAHGVIADFSGNPPYEFRSGPSGAGGDDPVAEPGYIVGEGCIGCKLCYSVCPRKCIDVAVKPVAIDRGRCILCGSCAEICPKQVIAKATNPREGCGT